MKNKTATRSKNVLSYKKAGVDINAGNKLVEKISSLAKSTQRVGASTSLGGFGALFDLKAAGYDDPILVAAADGVGDAVTIGVAIGTWGRSVCES